MSGAAAGAGGQDFFRVGLGLLDVIRPEAWRESGIESLGTPEAVVKERNWEHCERGSGEKAKSAGVQNWGCKAHCAAKRRRVLGRCPLRCRALLAGYMGEYPRRGGGTKWPDALESTPRRLQYPLPPGKENENESEREKEKIRFPQDLVWIKVTRPQIVARQCLREVSQEGRGWSL